MALDTTIPTSTDLVAILDLAPAQNSSFLCSNGLFIPTYIEKDWNRSTRAFLYFVALMYSFLGIAILADVFMCAIERITSATRKVKVKVTDEKNEDGSNIVQYREELIWNPTVANLTLMALGSSAPEILLSCIEIVGKNFYSGELGPGTIVGSAAYNLMAISAICIVALPSGETKCISQITVFAVTATWSCFAYIWLMIILMGTSPNRVEVWEGALTLVFFFALVITAYMADRKIFERCMKRSKRPTEGEDAAGQELSTPLKGGLDGEISRLQFGNGSNKSFEVYDHPEWREIERQAKLDYPSFSDEDLARLVAFRINTSRPKDYLEHRINTVRSFAKATQKDSFFDPTLNPSDSTGKGLTPSASVSLTNLAHKGRQKFLRVEFAARVYGIDPSQDRRVRLKIVRRGRMHKKMLCRYETVNGSAKANSHFLHKSETLVFEPNENEKFIAVDLVEGAEWKAKDLFTVKLEIDPHIFDRKIKVGKCNPAEVIYVGGDHDFDSAASSVEFLKQSVTVKESKEYARLPIIRKGNCKEKISVGWNTEDITAQQGLDYEGTQGTITFEEGEIEKYFDLSIIDDADVEKNEMFLVRLVSPSRNVTVAQNCRMLVTIINDDSTIRLFNKLDRMVPAMLASLQPGRQSWKQQFVQYLNVNGGDVSNATMVDYFGHILSFPWKAICAFVPPPSILGGWLTFVVALILIGIVTALVGDIAGAFGCLIGLEDTITAITFVALGTSLPDTFASRVAAIQDRDADNAVGNITGSNSVNVFLGLGLPWFIASIYWALKDKPFMVKSDGLGFSVTIYTICSLLTIALLIARRYLPVFGKAELGGPSVTKWASAIFLVFLWFMYVLLSALKVYGHIDTSF